MEHYNGVLKENLNVGGEAIGSHIKGNLDNLNSVTTTVM